MRSVSAFLRRADCIMGGAVLSDDISCAMVFVERVERTNGSFQRSGHRCLKNFLHDHFVRPSQSEVEQYKVATA